MTPSVKVELDDGVNGIFIKGVANAAAPSLPRNRRREEFMKNSFLLADH